MAAPARPAATPRPHKPWVPKHVRVIRSAQEHEHAAEIVRRCEALAGELGLGDSYASFARTVEERMPGPA